MSCLHTSCMSIRQYAIYHIISLNRLCLQFSMAYVMCLYIIPCKGRHLRCANCRHLDSFCCFHSLSALGRHRSEVRHRKLTSCLKEGSRYRVLGISYQHLNIWSIFLAISQKANTWCLQQARTKPDCALTNLAFRFCAAFMCALLALKA